MLTHHYIPHKSAGSDCRRVMGLAHTWPDGHYWSDKWEDVNCPDCLSARGQVDLSQDLSTINASYNDDTPMPFGRYVTVPLRDVPASYFHYLWSNKPIRDKLLEDYIRRSLNALKDEYPDGIW